MSFKKRTRFLFTVVFITLGLGVSAAENIVENGSFEEHGSLNHGNWGILSDIPGWNIETGHFEIQHGKVAGISASDGTDKLELDANFNSSIFADLSTKAGQPYLLKFKYSPRVQRRNTNTNNIEVWWEGKKLSLLSGSRRGWKEKNYLLKATGEVSRLKFKAVGKSDSLGGFIDDVQLIPLKSLGDNKVRNGSFEQHGVLNRGSWGTFNSIPGWRATKGLLEVQTGNVSGIGAVDGIAKAELDSNRNSRIRQRFTDLEEGELYQLILSYSPRVNNHRNTNKIKLRWNNKKLATLNGRKKKWRQFFYTVKAASSNALDIRARGRSDSYGGLVDDIQLYCLSCENNILPTAIAGNDQVVIAGKSVTLDGSASSDEEGQIVSYEWKQGSTILSTQAKFTKDDFSIGQHIITLTVTDNEGATATDEVIITVEKKPNIAPTVEAGADQTITEGDTLTLSATAADSDGQIASQQWRKGAELVGDTLVLSLNNLSVDVYTFTVTVTDNDGATATDSLKVTVEERPNTPAIAKNQSVTSNQDTAKQITLSASDVDGDTLTYTIETPPENGTLTATAPNITYTPNTGFFGEDRFTFKANDGIVDSNIATVSITVTRAPDTTVPVIRLNGGNQSLQKGQAYVEKGATAIDDRDGAIDVVITGTVNTNTVGIYTITYTATDSAGNIATEARTVTVIESADTTPPVITLNGGDITLNVGNTYTELGATAVDDRDGDISSNIVITGTIDTNTVGAYTLTYTATDAAGNTATATRTITVSDIVGDSTLEINITDPSGIPLIGATIQIYKDSQLQTKVVDTDAQFTSFSLPSETAYIIKVDKEGYATFVTAQKTPPSSYLIIANAILVPHEISQVVDNTIAQAITSDSGAKVSFEANSFMDTNGQSIDSFDVKITPINFTQRGYLAAFPGRFLGYTEDSSEVKPLVSYGVVDFTFGKNKAPLQLLDGLQATIEIPLFVTRELNGVDIQIGHVLPVWSLNEKQGIWQFESSGTVVASAQSPTGLAVSTTVSHFTYYSSGAFERDDEFIEVTVNILESKFTDSIGEGGGYRTVVRLAETNVPAYEHRVPPIEVSARAFDSANRTPNGNSINGAIGPNTNQTRVRFIRTSRNCARMITYYGTGEVVYGPVRCIKPNIPPRINPKVVPIIIVIDPDPVIEVIDEEELNFKPPVASVIWEKQTQGPVSNIISAFANKNNLIVMSNTLNELTNSGETVWVSSESFHQDALSIKVNKLVASTSIKPAYLVFSTKELLETFNLLGEKISSINYFRANTFSKSAVLNSAGELILIGADNLTTDINNRSHLFTRNSPSGETIWSTRLQAFANAATDSIPVSVSDFETVFVAQDSELGEFCERYDASNATPISIGCGDVGDSFYKISGNSLFSAGVEASFFGPSSGNYSLKNADISNGTIIWKKALGKHSVSALTSDAQGSIYISGRKYSYLYVMKFDRLGNFKWTKYFNNSKSATSIHVTPEDSLYIGGVSTPENGFIIQIANTPNDEDFTAPELTLLGKSIETVVLEQTYTDPGATAVDDRDGAIEVIIEGNVDTSTIGTYRLKYSAKDKAENISISYRSVYVIAKLNQPPVANAGQDKTIYPGSNETLDASASNDPDGEITSYTWKAGSTVLGTSQQLPLYKLFLGTHTIKLTVQDNHGATATDSVDIKVILPLDTTPPVITLNGSNESIEQGETYSDKGASAIDDRDGTINVVTTGTVDTNKIGVYTITYTATDAAGNIATKERKVTIVPAVLRDINISEYITEYQTTSEVEFKFGVSLLSQPENDVKLQIISSDETQGIIDISDYSDDSYLVFTPDNWNVTQIVTVISNKESALQGLLDFIVQTPPVISLDEKYNNIDPSDVRINNTTPKIILEAPKQLDFVANIYQWESLNYSYNGEEEVTLAIENAPSGMVLSNNRLEWTAPESSEDSDYVVNLVATTPSLTERLSFTAKVATTSPIQKSIDDNKLTLINDTCRFGIIDWGNFSITSKSTDIGKINESVFREVTSDVDYHIQAENKKLSCLFNANLSAHDNFDDTFKVTLPIDVDNIPDGYPVNNIKLYTFEPVVPFDGSLSGNTWRALSVNTEVVSNADGSYLEFDLRDLPNGLYYIGLEDTELLDISTAPVDIGGEVSVIDNETIQAAQRSTINQILDTEVISKCTPYEFLYFVGGELVRVKSSSTYQCQEFENGRLILRVLIRNFGSSTSRWNGITVDNLFNIMLDTLIKSSSLGLVYNPYIQIDIKDPKFLKGALGAMWYSNMYLTNNNAVSSGKMTGTIAHEFFHSFQFYTANESFKHLDSPFKEIAFKNLHGTSPEAWSVEERNIFVPVKDSSFGRDWVLEGQARWFEDYLDSGGDINNYNGLNTYRSKEGYGAAILKQGLVGYLKRSDYNRNTSLADDKEYRPYQRFTIWKMFEKKCQHFSSKNFIKNGILNLQHNDFGVNALNISLEEKRYSCDFGDQFGSADRGSLRSALLYYQYATQFKQPHGDLNLLDKEGNEPTGFLFARAQDSGKDILVSDDAWDSTSNNGYTVSYEVPSLPKASAHSFSLFLHTSLPRIIPEDKLLTIKVNSPGSIVLSIMSDDPLFNAKNTLGTDNSINHRWLEVNGEKKYHFKSGEITPKTLITFMNDGVDEVKNIEFVLELNTRKIAEKENQYITASCALGDDLFRWGGLFLPTIYDWALEQKPEISKVLDFCQDTVDIPDQSIPVTNCTANFESLIEQYPLTIRKNITDCITNKFKESFSDIKFYENPVSETERHIYWIDESNQQVIP